MRRRRYGVEQQKPPFQFCVMKLKDIQVKSEDYDKIKVIYTLENNRRVLKIFRKQNLAYSEVWKHMKIGDTVTVKAKKNKIIDIF